MSKKIGPTDVVNFMASASDAEVMAFLEGLAGARGRQLERLAGKLIASNHLPHLAKVLIKDESRVNLQKLLLALVNASKMNRRVKDYDYGANKDEHKISLTIAKTDQSSGFFSRDEGVPHAIISALALLLTGELPHHPPGK